jgi:hypothetical protein
MKSPCLADRVLKITPHRADLVARREGAGTGSVKGASSDAVRRRSPRYATTRMEAFSDGVSTIAITLLVFELSVPAGSGDDLLRAAGDRWPSYLAYVVSFSTVGRAVAGTQCDHQLPRALELGVVAAQLLVAHGGLVHAVPDTVARRVHPRRQSRTGRRDDLRHQPAAGIDADVGSLPLRRPRTTHATPHGVDTRSERALRSPQFVRPTTAVEPAIARPQTAPKRASGRAKNAPSKCRSAALA